MTTWRLLPDDGERDPRTNLAREEAVARHVAADRAAAAPVLRLWRNAPCVVIGRFQLGAAEVDVAAADALGAPILRRFTGGGTVWHDPGNLNVSVVLRPEDALFARDPALRRLPGLYRLILEPLASAARALGARGARATERDLVVDRPDGSTAKIGGVAAWLGGRALLVHGTLLVDADLAALARACAGPGAPGDPRWERTKSRRTTVTSITRELAVGVGAGAAAGTAGPASSTLPVGRHGGAPFLPAPDQDAVDLAVVAAFDAGAVAPSSWLPAELTAAERLFADRYGDPAWHADPLPTE